MQKLTNWKAGFTWGLITGMLGVAAYNIYADGFSQYTWLSHVCLAGMMWVLVPTGGALQEKLTVRKPQFWVAMAAMAGMVADVFVLGK